MGTIDLVRSNIKTESYTESNEYFNTDSYLTFNNSKLSQEIDIYNESMYAK